METRMPAEVFPPGEYLADELEARGWSQADFADIIGRPVQFVSEIINAKKELTAESASQIAAALGSEAETWLSLQARFRLWQLAQDASHRQLASRVAMRAQIAEIIPLAMLEKRGDIPRSMELAGLLTEVMSAFHMSNAGDPPEFCLAAKRTNHGDELTLTQRGWIWLARREALRREVPAYDEDRLRRLAEDLAHRTARPEHLANLPESFAGVGVHLVFVEHLPGGKIDGAAFMLGDNPVIAVSGRGKRFDKLFFAVMHEVAHVLCGHVRNGFALDDAAEAATDDPRETEANTLAETLALGGPVSLPAPISVAAVESKAAALGVPFAFVVGNLQHHGRLDWRTTLARGLPNADDVLRRWARQTLDGSSPA